MFLAEVNVLKKINPTETDSWKQLQEHFHDMKRVRMSDMFRDDPHRFSKMSITFGDMLVDFSKNIVNEKTMALLLGLAAEANLKEAIEALFSGDRINETENRAALHTALRNRSNNPVMLDGKDVMPEVNAELAHMKKCANRVSSGQWRGYSGKQITDIVNIGIRT
jgi:glucose-6-phosphate isomerase